MLQKMRALLRRLFNRLERAILSRNVYKFVIRDWQQLSDLDTLGQVLSTSRFSRNLIPLELACPKAKRVVVISPHPDDETLGAGVTLRKFLSARGSVFVIYLTDGNPDLRTADEARAVAEEAGYSVEFLGLPLNAIPCTPDVIDRLRSAIESHRPQAVFLPFMADDHDDHRRASELLLEAYGSRASPPNWEVWCYQVYTALLPNVVVDITDVAEQKAEAVRVYRSQSTRDWAHYILGLNAFNSRFIPTNGRPAFVEGFFVLPLRDYLDLCRPYFVDARAYYLSAYKNNQINGARRDG